MKKILMVVVCCCALAWQSNAQVYINEICPANADIVYDYNFYNFSPWIELYNAGNSTVSLTGYYLSDDPDNPGKWRIPSGSIPAKSFLLIWCDDMNSAPNHTNFSLDSEGEFAILSNASLTQVDKIEYPRQYTNVSYGRTSNGGASWAYLVTPTPNAGNNAATGTAPLDPPTFSVISGRYNGTQAVAIYHKTAGVEIRYTTDGSEPTVTSGLYTSPVSIQSTKTLKASAFKSGSIPGAAATATYFISEHNFTLPVVSISTKDAYLNDDFIGIYVDGKNGVQRNCSDSPKNYNQDWDRHAVFEYFDKDGKKQFDQHIDIRVGGACSRNNPQRSLVVKARDKYGSNVIRQKLFPNKEAREYGGFILRNAGNDFYGSFFRDAMEHRLVADKMDIDYLDYQPTTVYLNGKYWGILNMREKIDSDYIESNYGIDKDDLDLIETYENALEGSSDGYLNYKNTLQSMDRSTHEAFEYIDANIDVQEYINYLVTEIYVGNLDWPGNNMKFWRQRSTNGKFRWILWDMDFGFALYDGNAAVHQTLDFATDPDNTDWPNPAWSTLHIRLALENPEFREKFIATFSAALNTVFEPTRVISTINQFQTRIAAEMQYHQTRWNSGSIAGFNNEVQRMRDFASARNAFMHGYLLSFFGLPDNINMSVLINPVEAGSFKLNDVESDGTVTDMFYTRGVPYKLEPVSARGFKFKEWKVTEHESENIPLINRGDVWKYYDLNGSPGATWTTNSFNDAGWSAGPAQLGYGEGDEQTVTGYGPDINNKFITTYFRKSFTVSDTVGLQKIFAEALFDDGIVVYLNGAEVYRSNMPVGTIDNTTLAQTTVAENVFFSFDIAKGLLKPGSNVLAVEVHQLNATSSDLGFDLSMRTVRLGDLSSYTTATPQISSAAFSDVTMEALFVPDSRFVSGLVINEVNASPSSFLDEHNDDDDWFEIYNNGTSEVNLAGLYLTDDISKKKKHKILPGSSSEMILAPGGYKIFWADDEAAEGADHVRFKLSDEGEMVGLYQEIDGTIYKLDEADFGAQIMAGSFSRIPNATGPLVFVTSITPGNLNEQIITEIGEEISVGVFPNPVKNYLWIRSSSRVEKASMFDCLGHEILSFTNVTNEKPLAINGIVPGLYFVRIFTGNRWSTVRIVKE